MPLYPYFIFMLSIIALLLLDIFEFTTVIIYSKVLHIKSHERTRQNNPLISEIFRKSPIV